MDRSKITSGVTISLAGFFMTALLYVGSYKLADYYLFDGRLHYGTEYDPFAMNQHSEFWKIYTPLIRLEHEMLRRKTEDLSGDWGGKDFHVRIQGEFLMMISNTTNFKVPESAKVRRKGGYSGMGPDEVFVSSEDGEMISLFSPFQMEVMYLPRYEP